MPHSISQSVPASSYSVIQLEDRHWYPVHVNRFYSANAPDGTVSLDLLPPSSMSETYDVYIHYSRRSEAIKHCQRLTARDEEYEQSRWVHLTIESNLYPERCSHYIDLITQIAGQAPDIFRYTSHVSVYTPSFYCSRGELHHWHQAQSDTIEDALEQATNLLYAEGCTCGCLVTQDAIAMSVA